VKAFFDTSVLVAAFQEVHIHHAPSLATFLAFDKKQACCSLHTLAELYSTLTRMPNTHVSGNEALRFIENVERGLTLITLEALDYRSALERAATEGMTGGLIYDAILIQSAIKAKAETIYTWNVVHFRRFGPDVAKRVKAPSLQ
jgi:predicted nucleic acid-binding protein